MIYKNKLCVLCKTSYTPTSPTQKYCDLCKEDGRKIKDKERDRRRNRVNNNYKEYTKYCKVCGKQFKTYYKKKLYCGSSYCELERKRLNSIKVEINRNRKLREQTKLNKEITKKLKLKEISEHVSKFGYTLIDSSAYVNSHNSYLTLECPNGHIWDVTYHGFKDCNNRCIKCYTSNNYISKPEQSIRDFFEYNFKNINIVYNDREQIVPKEIDLYFPDQKVGVEVCGLYWHSEINNSDRSYHYNKMNACYKKGIRLITIFEDEIYSNYDVVISRISQALGLNTKRIYARKCTVKEIDSKTANKFFMKYHLQGRSTALKAWGLFYNNEMVSVCSVGKVIRKHTSTDTTLELKRLCTLPYITVVGGASKLFKRVKLYAKQEGYSIIKSYCDMRYANIFNPIYEKLGFTLNSLTKYTPHYTKNGKRYRNYSLRKTPEERFTNKTEAQLREAQGYSRIWDCGHRTYVYVIN